MAWTKHFSVIKSAPVMPTVDRSQAYSSMTARTSSWLNIAYQGNPQRIPRYYQFQEMDNDSDINTALDTIADFCTQSEEQSDEPFEVKFNGDPNESETKIINQMLDRWIKINNFRSRLWYMFRDTIKNGDAFFLRDPETFEWLWLDHFMVELVKVDETKGKVPDEYIVRGLDYNRQNKFATKQADPNAYRTPFGTSTVGGARPTGGSSSSPSTFSMVGSDGDQRQRGMQGPYSQELSVIDAQFVVHLSLSIGNDINWPFGPSILEPIFKTFKQKELLEDAIIIYRVQRAPERRIFYIDVGTMPPERAKRHIEAIKNDIHQRRIPNRTGTGGCFDMNTQVPLLDGRTLSISELAVEYQNGKQNWAYSCDPNTGQPVPGKITWAGVTRRNAQVMKLTLDNGETIICTPDHKFPVQGRGKTEAKEVAIDVDSLISFNTRLFSINETPNSDDPVYHQVYDHSDKKWKFTHRVVGSFMKARDQHNELGLREKKTVIHHHDFNRFNNTPENLFHMNGYEHFLLHTEHFPQLIAAMTAEQVIAFRQKHSASAKSMWELIRVDRPDVYEAMKQRLQDNVADHQKRPWPNQGNQWSERLFEILVFTMHSERGGKKETASHLSNNPEFMSLYCSLNKSDAGGICHLDLTKFSVTSLEKLVKHFGYAGWIGLLKSHGYDIRKPTLGIKTNHELIAAIINVAKALPGQKLLDVCEALTKNSEFMVMYKSLNTETKGMSNRNKISINTVKSIIAKHGYTTWTDFRQKMSLFNHKVVAAEYVDNMDVGTITIDGNEEFHKFHTFALKQGVYAYNSIMDAAYNPLSINDDYFFANNSDGRGSKVETLPGGDGNNEILDLTFFSKKLARGLRVPVSYLNIGDDSSSSVTFNDGKLGAAMIQEYRFSKYCMRLQSLLAPNFDREFKRYLQKNGIEIEAGLFELAFNPPQSFTRYRQIELDTQRVAVYQGVAENKKLAERFKLKRFLGLSEDEIIENEEMWSEENADKLKKKTGASPAESGQADGLGAVGIHPEGDMGMGDLPEGEMPEGGDTEGTPGGAPPAAPGAGAVPAASPGGAPPA